MVFETLKNDFASAPDETEPREQRSERRPAGPLSDYEEGERAAVADVEAFIASASAPRDPEEELDIARDGKSAAENLQTVEQLISKEREKEDALGAVRAELGTPHESGTLLRKLEEVQEKLAREHEQVKLVDKYENVFDEFSRLSHAERARVLKTGKTRDGKYFHDKYGARVRTDVTKELARVFIDGGGRITWGSLRRLRQVVDKILKDVTAAFTGMFTGPERSDNAPDLRG